MTETLFFRAWANDRLHFYTPAWDVPKLAAEHFTSAYGFVVARGNWRP